MGVDNLACLAPLRRPGAARTIARSHSEAPQVVQRAGWTPTYQRHSGSGGEKPSD